MCAPSSERCYPGDHETLARALKTVVQRISALDVPAEERSALHREVRRATARSHHDVQAAQRLLAHLAERVELVEGRADRRSGPKPLGHKA